MFVLHRTPSLSLTRRRFALCRYVFQNRTHTLGVCVYLCSPASDLHRTPYTEKHYRSYRRSCCAARWLQKGSSLRSRAGFDAILLLYVYAAGWESLNQSHTVWCVGAVVLLLVLNLIPGRGETTPPNSAPSHALHTRACFCFALRPAVARCWAAFTVLLVYYSVYRPKTNAAEQHFNKSNGTSEFN